MDKKQRTLRISDLKAPKGGPRRPAILPSSVRKAIEFLNALPFGEIRHSLREIAGELGRVEVGAHPALYQYRYPRSACSYWYGSLETIEALRKGMKNAET